MMNGKKMKLPKQVEKYSGFIMVGVLVLLFFCMSKKRVIEAVEVATKHNSSEYRLIKPVKDYEADNVSKKVLRIILSYVDYVNRTVWHKEV